MDRFCIKIAGESGSGLLSTGEIIIKALHSAGFYVVADREYPSLIKGPHACFVINISKKPIYGLSKKVDALMAIDRASLEAYFDGLKEGGVLVHGLERLLGLKELFEKAEERKIKTVHLNARETAEECGGNVLMSNMVLIGMIWKALGFDYSKIENRVEEKFKSKPKLLEIDLKCLKAGYDGAEKIAEVEQPIVENNTILMDGNKSIALGAVHAGCRAYFAYPMSPSSSILTHFAKMSEETGVLVKQVEDEISVANMTLGAMHMGTRALAATSGGGYDLMTETVSLAGITETPLVLVIAQRPGPGTGLPTWTSQGDLNLAIYSSHGEFSRVVIGVSNPADAFDLIQHAFNFAEKYQSVAVVLTEKTIAESLVSIAPFEEGKIPIERGLSSGPDLVNSDRFKITESGLSKRWIPCSEDAYYFANGDEHKEDGSLTEDPETAALMYAKRMRKIKLIEDALPEAEIYGVEEGADYSFIGWGSSKNAMLDVIDFFEKEGVKVNYLHYSYLWPFKKEKAERFFAENKNVFLIEGNYQGQFGNIVEASGLKFKERLLKYDGRPFFLEDVVEFINKQS